ncbi:vWA domain-containing protein [Thalassotalea sp. PS06]|uniref:vWA domain-containing protein n=1 Tax=Thalassotalea sp. PS06 TaxID=2594005 RepID=UPI001162850F|nr:VWA domain-containing protein [Thalassotalea sp. PS06]QDP01780.1 VWA domain-containing protein [Thalassotalea sp. PS06]
MLDNFHFLRPLWLLAFFALLYVIWQLKKLKVANSAWQRVVPKHLNKVLLSTNGEAKPLALLPIVVLGSLLIVAMAGPTWKKLPQPVYQTDKASVIVMDMSFSMLATDTKPNRLTRARFKALDLLEKLSDGDVALIAYAGDAFVISPLTEDINNIRLLLPSLTPQIMPELGSNPYPALILANDMLANAGYNKGDIYWLTDGIDGDDLQDINEFSRDNEHSINILGIGTEQGAPITLENGELMRDRGGNIVIPKLNARLLAGISERNDGIFQSIRNDDEDISRLANNDRVLTAAEKQEQQMQGDQWQEFGPYLLLIALPVLLLYCRKGVLLAVPLVLTTSLCISEPVQASIWDDLWKRSDQQAQDKFSEKDFSGAAEQFQQPNWKASALYKAGEYEQALEAFNALEGTDAVYNRGNTLAQLQRFEDAITAYDEVLAQQPEHQDALANKALVEQLMQQQEQQNQDQNQDQNQQNQDQQNQDQQNQNQQNSEQQNQDQSNPDQQNQDQQNQDQQNQDQQDQQSQDQQDQNQQDQDQQQQNQDQQNQDQQNSPNQQQSEEDPDSEQREQEAQGANQTEQDQQQDKSEEPGQAKESQAQLTEQELEQQQKHQQILKKVTDDPNLLLRNKMRLEYRKRRQNRSSIGVTEKW